MKEGSNHTEETKAKISEAMQGRYNAEKWTESLVSETLDAMWDYSNEECKVKFKVSKTKKETSLGSESSKKVEIVKRKVHLKKKLLIVFGIKNQKWFAQMAEKFSQNETISYLLGAIDMVCEVNTYEDAANNATNVAMAKMNLSHHYGWQGKSQFETKDKEVVTDEELDKAIAEYQKRNES